MLYRMSISAGRTNVPGVVALVRNTIIGNNAPATTNFMRVTDGIVHFRVVPFDSRGSAITLNTSNAPGTQFSAQGYAFSTNSLPSYVDIELAVLEPKSVEQLRVRGTNNINTVQAYLASQPGRMHFFKRRVALRNAPEYFSVANVP